MFQKDIEVMSETSLRKSDVRKLKQQFIETFLPDFPHITTTNNNNNKNHKNLHQSIDALLNDIFRVGLIRAQKCRIHGKEEEEKEERNRKKSKASCMIYIRLPDTDASTIKANSSTTSSLYDVNPLSHWPFATPQPLLIELAYKLTDATRFKLVPCLSLLSICSALLPRVTVHVPVSKFLCSGADLMKPGVLDVTIDYNHTLNGALLLLDDVTTTIINKDKGQRNFLLKKLKKGDLMSVVVKGNDTPFAVGELIMEADETYGHGTHGLVIRVVHVYGDSLWHAFLPDGYKARSENKQINFHRIINDHRNNIDQKPITLDIDDGDYGNIGFIGGGIVFPNIFQTTEESSPIEDIQFDKIDLNNDEKLKAQEIDSDDASKHDEKSVSEVNFLKESFINDSNSVEKPENNVEKKTLNQDELLITAFYLALCTSVKDKMLPLPLGQLFAGHILKAVANLNELEAAVLNNNSQVYYLDMKDTKYKKITEFLKEQQKLGSIELSLSSEGKDPDTYLKSINRSFHLYRDIKKQLGEKIAAMVESKNGQTNSLPESKLKVVTLFRIPLKVTNELALDQDVVLAMNAKSDARRGTGFLTAAECNTILSDYITQNNLIDSNDASTVHVDGPLCNVLYKLSQKEMKRQKALSRGDTEQIQMLYPDRISRKDLQEKWSSKLEKGYAIVAMPGSIIREMKVGKPPMVSIEVEKGPGGRRGFVTRIRGLEAYDIDGTSFAKDLSKRFASSASAESHTTNRGTALKKGCVEVCIQGNLSEEVKALLTNNSKLTTHGGAKGGSYNVPKEIIHIELKKGVTKKKQR